MVKSYKLESPPKIWYVIAPVIWSIICEVFETSLPCGYQLLSSFHSKYSKYPFSTIYSVARKLKKGSNSFNSNPYSALWDLIKNDVEKASINIPITNTWCNLKLKFPTWNNWVELTNNKIMI